MSFVTSAKTCGGKTRPSGSPPNVWRATAVARLIDPLAQAGELAVINNRPDECFRVIWIADPSRCGRR
jgi:hypothetical protein